MQKTLEHLGFVSTRKFGLELELNAFDGKSKPDGGGSPAGLEYVGKLLNEHTDEGADVKGWENTNNNARWVVKPDSSCGMEVCTPPVSGWNGLSKICRVVELFSKDPKIKSDERCSVHAHIDMSNLDTEKIARVLGWYIKCEPVIMDMVPEYRRNSKYCQTIGMTSVFSHDQKYSNQEIINIISDYKYYSMNAKALRKDSGRRTIEFRIVEGDGCRDAYLIKNWVRFLLHFIERAAAKPLIMDYIPGNPFTHLCWLDPEDFFRFLGFSNNPQEYHLSMGLAQTRNWILARWLKFMPSSTTGPRSYAYQEFMQMLARFKSEGTEINVEEHLSPKELSVALYENMYRY